MNPNKIYLADKSQLVMHGIDAIIKQNFDGIGATGMASEPKKILSDLVIDKPEVIIIDETIMLNQELPLIIFLSLRYPQLFIIALTDHEYPLYHKFADSYLSKPSFAPEALPLKLKTERPDTFRYGLGAGSYEYFFLLGVYAISNIEKTITEKILPFIPMSVTIDTIPLSSRSAMYVFHFMRTSYAEMEKYRNNLTKHISHSHCPISFKVSEIIEESVESNEKIINFLLNCEKVCVKTNREVKLNQFNRDEFERMLQKRNADQALDLLTAYIEKSEEADLDILVCDVKKCLRLLSKKMNSEFLKAKIQYVMNGMSKDNYRDFKVEYLKFREQAVHCISQGEEEREQELADSMADYIREHYGYHVTASLLAEQFRVQESYLKELAKQYFKKPFKSYVDCVRVEEAADMLKNTEYSIAEISYRAGYANVGYFDRIFKRYTGYTLKQYREINNSK